MSFHRSYSENLNQNNEYQNHNALMTQNNQLKIGVDYGNVCSTDAEGYERNDNNEYGINVPDCLPTLQRLKNDGHILYLISFCGNNRAVQTKRYFDSLPNNPFAGLFFVKNRDYKNYICRHLGLDVMIDDRNDVLCTITDAITIQFTQYVNAERRGRYIPNIRAGSWVETYNYLSNLRSLALVPETQLDISRYCY